jgi:hypothetical protein
MQACVSLRPAGGGGGGGFLNSPQSAAYRNCLTQHGVTFPAAGANNNGQGPNSSLANNPTFQAAQQACAPLRPARSTTTSTTTTSTTATSTT